MGPVARSLTRGRRGAMLAASLACSALFAACSHDWDAYDSRLGPDGGVGSGGDATVSSGSTGGAGATGAGPASSSASSGAGGSSDLCGNGLADPMEECDDANDIATDGCDDCHVICDGTAELEDPATHECYTLLAPSSWAAGVTGCQDWGGHLATVTTQAELDFVRTFVVTNVWLGGNELAQRGVWVWDNGEPWSFEPWNTGEPNNAGPDSGLDEDCLELYDNVSDADPFGFADDSCTHVQPPVCEREPVFAN